MDKKKKRMYGQFNTVVNPFGHLPAIEWLKDVEGLAVIEPFVGNGNLVEMLPDLKWSGFFDLEPQNVESLNVVKRDTILDFPNVLSNGLLVEAVVTNPPWLSTRSASARKIPSYRSCIYDDVYKTALAVCLKNVDWVAAILPESFVKSGLFVDKLWAVVRLTYKVFEKSIEHPACLALFSPLASGDPEIWDGDIFLGRLSSLKQHLVLQLPAAEILKVDFLNPQGEVGIYAFDSRLGPTIRFVLGDEIPSERIKHTSRHIIRAALPVKIDHKNLKELIELANLILANFRLSTRDVTLTAARSLRHDGEFRRRLDFDTTARILTLAFRSLEDHQVDHNLPMQMVLKD